MTAFLLTPDFTAKTVQCKGSLAVGELAPLEVRNVAGNLAGLRVRIRYEGRDVAMFPLTETDAWSAEGESAKAFIELNTVQLRKCFKHLDDNAVVQCNVIVESNDGDRLLICKGMVNIKNWPAAPGQVPVSLATWTDDVAELREEVAKVGDNLKAHESSADAHKVLFDKKTDKTAFDQHAAATNAHGVTPETIGAAKASDLDNHKADTQAHQGLFDKKLNAEDFRAHTAGQQLSHSASDSKLLGLEQDFNRHDHGKGGGKKINHADLDNIGTKTHNQLEESVSAAAAAAKEALTKVQGKASLQDVVDAVNMSASEIMTAVEKKADAPVTQLVSPNGEEVYAAQGVTITKTVKQPDKWILYGDNFVTGLASDSAPPPPLPWSQQSIEKWVAENGGDPKLYFRSGERFVMIYGWHMRGNELAFQVGSEAGNLGYVIPSYTPFVGGEFDIWLGSPQVHIGTLSVRMVAAEKTDYPLQTQAQLNAVGLSIASTPIGTVIDATGDAISVYLNDSDKDIQRFTTADSSVTVGFLIMMVAPHQTPPSNHIPLNGTRQRVLEVWINFTNTTAPIAVSWPASVKWIGEPPTITTGEYRFRLWTIDGMTIYAWQIQPDASITQADLLATNRRVAFDWRGLTATAAFVLAANMSESWPCTTTYPIWQVTVAQSIKWLDLRAISPTARIAVANSFNAVTIKARSIPSFLNDSSLTTSGVTVLNTGSIALNSMTTIPFTTTYDPQAHIMRVHLDVEPYLDFPPEKGFVLAISGLALGTSPGYAIFAGLV